MRASTQDDVNTTSNVDGKKAMLFTANDFSMDISCHENNLFDDYISVNQTSFKMGSHPCDGHFIIPTGAYVGTYG